MILRAMKWTCLMVLAAFSLHAQEPPPPPVDPPPPDAPGMPEAVVEVITFHADAGKLYITLEDAAEMLGWAAYSTLNPRQLMVNESAIPKEERRRLTNGMELLSMEALVRAGTEVNVHPSGLSATVIAGEKQFTVMRAEKRVEVSLGEQRLRGWQGARLVLETKVSTGRSGRTPAGSFKAGPYRARLHRSKLYHNAAMPWSVQINGHIFVHGFSSVPDYPASHGCVRMPLTGANPARFFYEWVDAGTPVAVVPAPPKEKKALAKKKK
jgi:lipoprotein-anchoring transpeptidase ErfK/SrfK